jgi:hypothetical protein
VLVVGGGTSGNSGHQGGGGSGYVRWASLNVNAGAKIPVVVGKGARYNTGKPGNGGDHQLGGELSKLGNFEAKGGASMSPYTHQGGAGGNSGGNGCNAGNPGMDGATGGVNAQSRCGGAPNSQGAFASTIESFFSVKKITAGAGGKGGTASHSGGGGGGGVLINGQGPRAQDGGADKLGTNGKKMAGKGGFGYGAGGGCGGYDSSGWGGDNGPYNWRAAGGAGANGVVYIEWGN